MRSHPSGTQSSNTARKGGVVYTIPMQLYVFGNPMLPQDAGPLTLLPALRAALPQATFTTLDPNEEWDVPTHMHVIDTVVNLTEPRVFHDLTSFMAAPRMTCHDFDAYANLTLMHKLGKLTGVTIYGLPPHPHEARAVSWLKQAIIEEYRD